MAIVKKPVIWKTLTLAAMVVLTLVAFGSTALAHEEGSESHHQRDSRQEEQPSASGEQQKQQGAEKQGASEKGQEQQNASREESPPMWLPVAFTVSGLVVVGSVVLVLRRS